MCNSCYLLAILVIGKGCQNILGRTCCLRNMLTLNILTGASTRVRTADLLITNQLLYQLSYTGSLLQFGIMNGSRQAAGTVGKKWARRLGRFRRSLRIGIRWPDRQIPGPARCRPGAKSQVLQRLLQCAAARHKWREFRVVRKLFFSQFAPLLFELHRHLLSRQLLFQQCFDLGVGCLQLHFLRAQFPGYAAQLGNDRLHLGSIGPACGVRCGRNGGARSRNSRDRNVCPRSLLG